MSLPIEGAFDVTAVLLLAFGAMTLRRRQSAALRHCVLAAALVSGALLPLAEPLLPQWRLPVRINASSVLDLTPSTRAATPTAGADTREFPQSSTPVSRPLDVASALARIWAFGALAAFGALLFGFVRLRHLAGSTRGITDPRWLAHLAAVRSALGVTRPVTLLETRDSRFLVVWGVLRPRVLLPPIARDWSDARVRLVLTHELAHVQRGDWMIQCARVLRRQRTWIPAPAIAHTTGFERRIQAMLNARLNRRPLSRRTIAATVAVCLSLALPIAAFTAQTALVSFAGSVLDPSNAVLPNAVVTLTNIETQAKYEVRTNRDGRYEIPALPAGRYVLQSTVPGFETVKLDLTVGGENIQRDLRLELGTLQETITVVAGGAARPPREMTPEQRASLEERLRKRAAQTCPDGPRTTPAIGGNIRVPVKLRDVRPIYPADLASTGVSGQVVLLAVIGTDGRVQDVTVQSASHGEFAAAAIDAVRQWEFDATLLNCVPVETRMTVTANFRISN